MDFKQAFDDLPEGWLSENEAKLLWESASKARGPILEVGCFKGRSTVLLARLGRLVYSVDPFDGFVDDESITGDDIQNKFSQNLSNRKIRNVRLFREPIETWNIRPVEFAYLDGDHTKEGTLSQIEVATKCGARRICLHDYADKGGGRLIKEAIEESPLRLMKVVERMAYCLSFVRSSI